MRLLDRAERALATRSGDRSGASIDGNSEHEQFVGRAGGHVAGHAGTSGVEARAAKDPKERGNL